MAENFMKRVSAVQKELKAPKGQYNSFGKYHYRSCEDILEAVKPICNKYGIVLTVSDELTMNGEWHYIKATATLYDTESDATISNTAYARESETKKGMDESQITGTASSYARKYALNGLFCIDDTKDADTDEYTNNQNRSSAKSKPTAEKKNVLKCSECGAEVTDYRKADGTIIPASKVLEGCGGKCLKCFQKGKE